ncbi:MAG TPA: mechanosensitive ion channel domain-containing protein [Pyrinomonadaceae bacterium]|jgi:small-conductance mechanosensitive channel|nr:mechanosensitive ion channel domain-containing protein [Pyrinomonadaceae bacterium]
MSLLFPIAHRFSAAVFLWDALSIFRSIWSGLTFKLIDSPNMKVTAFRLIVGITLLVAVLVLSGRLSTLLDRRIAKRTHINAGLRYTIARLIRYLLLVIGLVSVLKGAFDLDLTSVAVLFTALSVGIGFGLQYIAADIASGFILLFERPVRVGDRITIGEDEGDVQSIKLRTTIIYTNDRIAIIVPNSRLVSQRVINWSYGDPRARIAIPISVATTSDVDHVTTTLLQASENIESVLTDPQPKVQFLRFGEYSLDFRLLVWTRQPNRHVQIKSDINYRIERLFRESGIEIPYPKQEFLLRRVITQNEDEALIAEESARDGETPQGSKD